ncbi:MAG: AraC family transcriptional regulator [Colwellia sp.]|nr:AraC family transcriptional regulator [Colwellia sp.]
MRIDKIKVLLAGTAPLAGVSVQVGFSNQSHMSRNFKTLTGMTPARYRQALLS